LSGEKAPRHFVPDNQIAGRPGLRENGGGG
jgi:hypothetical protein